MHPEQHLSLLKGIKAERLQKNTPLYCTAKKLGTFFQCFNSNNVESQNMGCCSLFGNRQSQPTGPPSVLITTRLSGPAPPLRSTSSLKETQGRDTLLPHLTGALNGSSS